MNIFELPEQGTIHDLEDGGPINIEPGQSCVNIQWPDECGSYSHLIVHLPEARKLVAALICAIADSEHWELHDLEERWDAS